MMPALIIAAGRGTRLRPYSEERPKSLFELAPGKTIASFILDRLERRGFREIYLVTRPEYGRMFEEELGGRARVIELDVEEEEFGNLYPVFWAVRKLGLDRFLLLMSDHIFEYEMLERITSAEPGKAFVVCLDRSPEWDKAEEGLKLRLRGWDVVDVGKRLPPVHGIDTGLIMVLPRARRFIEEAYRRHGAGASISQALRLAAGEGEVGYVDVTGLAWMDVDTPRDLLKARDLYWDIVRREISRGCRSATSRLLVRPVSGRISVWLYRNGVRLCPAYMPLLAFLAASAASLLIYAGLHTAAALTVYAYLVLDGMFEDLSSLAGGVSGRENALKSLLGVTSEVLLVLAVSLAAGGGAARLLGPMAASGVAAVSYASGLAASLGPGWDAPPGDPPPFAAKEARMLSVSASLLLGAPWAALYYLSASTYIFLAYTMLAVGMGISFTSARRERRRPLPVVVLDEEDVRGYLRAGLESLISNSAKLVVGMFLISLVRPYVPGLSLDLGYLSVGSHTAISALQGVLIIFYGYRILQSLSLILEMAADVVSERLRITGSAYRSLVLNASYVTLLVIVWYAMTPIATSAPEQLRPAFLAASLVVLSMILVLGYRLFKVAKHGLAGVWNRALGAVVDRIARHHVEGAEKG